MNSSVKPARLILNIESHPCFSASFVKSGISALLRLSVSGFQAKVCDKLEISVKGMCGEVEFLKRYDFVRESFCPDNYNFKKNGTCTFDFSANVLKYDMPFLMSLSEQKEGEIYVMVRFGASSVTESVKITLAPCNFWAGLDTEPAMLASFCNFSNSHIQSIYSKINSDLLYQYYSADTKSMKKSLEEIYKSLKACNIIYSRPAGYSVNMSQTIRLFDQIFTGTSILATPLEMAIVFCAVSKKCGYDTSLIFARGAQGEMMVFCGFWTVPSRVAMSVCDDENKLLDFIKYNELVVVEPSVFAAAQNTSFALSCQNTKEMFLKGSLDNICMIDIKNSFKFGIEPLFENIDVRSNDNVPFNEKAAISALYKSLRSKPVMKMLSGSETGRFPELALLCDFDELYFNENKKVLLTPLDANVDLRDFAGLDKGFSSILTNDFSLQRRSDNEKLSISARLERLKDRIFKDELISVPLKEDVLYDICSKMTFEKSPNKPYIVFGYVKMYDKLCEISTYAPICLVEAKFEYSDGSFGFVQTSKPVVNKVFIRNALSSASLGYDSFLSSLMPTDRAEVMELFENIKSALCETDDRYTYEIIKEAHIVHCDLSDYLLWSDIALTSKKMAESDAVKCILGDSKQTHEKSFCTYEPEILLENSAKNAVCTNNNCVVTGPDIEAKKSVICQSVKRSVTEGKSVLVVTKDKDASEFVHHLLCENGAGEVCLNLDAHTDGADVAREISGLLVKYKDLPESNISHMPNDFDTVKTKIMQYENKLNFTHKTGFSLREALYSYFDANSTINDMDELYVDKDTLSELSQEGLDALFTMSHNLVMSARRLCRASGMQEHSPINTHALFGTRPKSVLDDTQKAQLSELCEKVYPVLAQYRDIFSDVSSIVGFETNEIKTLSSLLAFNDLYKLALSARDVEIPEDFVRSDINLFSERINRITSIRERCMQIQHKLSFFQPEIFEDVEILLSGEKTDDGEKGILKKFMYKKNNQDLLLQYVSSDKKSEFSGFALDEIYALLNEYKDNILKIESESCAGDDANTEKLAQIASLAKELSDKIAGKSDADIKRRLSGIFRLITIIPVDSALARNITVARARLEEIVCGDDSALGMISKILGADFESLCFDNGILASDGLSDRIKGYIENADITDKWIKWLCDSDEARSVLPSFVTYIERSGATGNAHRLFAKSLLKPVCECIANELFEKKELDEINVAKEKYVNLLRRCGEISKLNFETAHSQSVRHLAKTNDYSKLSEIEDISFREFYENNKHLVSKVKPCIIVGVDKLSQTLPVDAMFDSVIVVDDKTFGYSPVCALSYGKRVLITDMTPDLSGVLSMSAARNNMQTFVLGKVTSRQNALLYPWISSEGYGEKLMNVNADVNSACELVRMNGLLEKDSEFVNVTEAQLALQTVMSGDVNQTYMITSLCPQQTTYIARLCASLHKKSKVLKEAQISGRIMFAMPEDLYKYSFDNLVVSCAYSTDKHTKFPRQFGNAHTREKNMLPDTYVSICTSNFKKLYVLTSLNANETKLIYKTGLCAKYFCDFCEVLSEGRIPVNVASNHLFATDSLLPQIISSIGAKNSKYIMCNGKNSISGTVVRTNNESELYVMCDNDESLCLHDELVIKDMLSKNSSVVTLSPVSLALDDDKSILESFRKD